jgi:uncharacterized RDD family membrane protein YckC
METLDSFRARYGSMSDEELHVLVLRGAELMPEARQAVAEELRRRQIEARESAAGGAVWTNTILMPRYGRAPLGRRVRAFLLDLLVAFLPLFIIFVLVGDGLISGHLETPIDTLRLFLFFAGAAAWAVGYTFAKDGRADGQSIGKKYYGLMVVNVDTNQPCTTRESIRRQVELFFLLLLPMVGWLIEPAVVLLSEDGRRLGDRAAHTQVIAVEEYVLAGPIEVGRL